MGKVTSACCVVALASTLVAACVSPRQGTASDDAGAVTAVEGDPGRADAATPTSDGGDPVDGTPAPGDVPGPAAAPDAPRDLALLDGALDTTRVPACGNGMVETGEECEPLATCNAMAAGCTSDANYVRTPSGDPARCTFRCTTTTRACSSGDGYCPGGCSFPGDSDCKKAIGQACGGSNSECLSGHCASGFCCDQACAGGCHSCAAAQTSGANGTCLPVRAGADPKNNCTAQPATSCLNDGSCDGAGKCRQHASTTVCSPSSCSPNGTEQPVSHCTGSGACNTQPAITCSRSCGAESCGPGTCALNHPYYCMFTDTASSITQCEGHISGKGCDGNPSDEPCDKTSTYLYLYKRLGVNRYDLITTSYYVCDWDDQTPAGERLWHEGS